MVRVSAVLGIAACHVAALAAIATAISRQGPAPETYAVTIRLLAPAPPPPADSGEIRAPEPPPVRVAPAPPGRAPALPPARPRTPPKALAARAHPAADPPASPEPERREAAEHSRPAIEPSLEPLPTAALERESLDGLRSAGPPSELPSLTPAIYEAGYLSNPKPPYPLAARRRGDQGTVLVDVEVSAEGTVKSVRLAKSSGSPRLDRAALEAIEGWRFVAARRGTQAVASAIQVPIVFRLED